MIRKSQAVAVLKKAGHRVTVVGPVLVVNGSGGKVLRLLAKHFGECADLVLMTRLTALPNARGMKLFLCTPTGQLLMP